MAVVKDIGKALVSPALFLASKILKKPKKPEAAPLRAPGRGNAVADALQQRRGATANQRTGASGAESNTSQKKTVLGIGG